MSSLWLKFKSNLLHMFQGYDDADDTVDSVHPGFTSSSWYTECILLAIFYMHIYVCVRTHTHAKITTTLT